MKQYMLLALAAAFLLFTGCSTLQQDDESEPARPASAAQGNPQAVTETYEESNYYYDFSDILVPRELEFKGDESYVFDTSTFKAGVMNFSGRVVNEDLVNFFINNMAKDGWKMTTSLKSDKSILIFEKFNKACSIQVVKGTIFSKVIIFAVEAKGGSGSTMQPGAVSSPKPQTYSPPPARIQEQDLR